MKSMSANIFSTSARLLGSLLSELSQPARRSLEQDDEFHQLGVQRVAGQKFLQNIRLDFCLRWFVKSDRGRLIKTNLIERIGLRRLRVQLVASQQLLQTIRLCFGFDSRLNLLALRNLRREFGPELVELIGIPHLKFLANFGERRHGRHRLCPHE